MVLPGLCRMTPLTASILSLSDQGQHVAAIASSCQVSPGYVYGVLREHRPGRKRKPRERTSEKRRFILGLLAQGIQPPRVAFLAQCSRAYVAILMKQENIR